MVHNVRLRPRRTHSKPNGGTIARVTMAKAPSTGSDRVASDKVVCRTPTPNKRPTRIPRWKFDAVADAIRTVVPRAGDGVVFKDLPGLVAGVLGDDVKHQLGSVGWHVATVKLELEVRGELVRVPRAKPQRLRRRS